MSTPDWTGVPEALRAPDRHGELVAAEQAAAASDPPSARRALIVRKRIQDNAATDTEIGPIDWERELSAFRELEYPEYYRQPFHSVHGGWLSKRAALVNRAAMNAIYQDAHPRSIFGVREELARFVPADAREVVDLGCGDGDGAAAVTRVHASARVTALDASPFMIIVGRRLHAGNRRVEFVHGLAERTGLPAEGADAVTVTLVLHECPDDAKRAILREAFRILRPGGTIVLSDTPQTDLHTFRGFYEPYKDEWALSDPGSPLAAAGFAGVRDRGIVGGDGEVKTPEAHRSAVDAATTESRIFVFTAVKPAAGAPPKPSL